MRAILCLFALLMGASEATAALPACFVDCQWGPAFDKRQLESFVCNVDGPCKWLSREWCGHFCKNKSYPIAGVEAGHGCFCGKSLRNASAIAPVTDCNMPCTGVKDETCGGSCRLYAFASASVGPVPPRPPPPPTPKPLPVPDLPMTDERFIPNGEFIHDGGYCCQPYCAVLPDKSWSCTMTFNDRSWAEGSPGQHMIATRTTDHGKSWSEFVAVSEYSNTSTSGGGAYGSILASDDGSRLFSIFIYNSQNVSHLPGP
jgi:hypothetical protein